MSSYVEEEYDVLVVGAGHAGCEAALASARIGCRTLLLTLNIDNVALMPCNPAVGGPAKGQLVREVDALGGQMGINTDNSFIQIRMLNTAKGPAVHALRAQSDKRLYQRLMLETIEKQENLDLKQAEVVKVFVKGDTVTEVLTKTGLKYKAKAIVITSGTYLGGKVFIGRTAWESGPNNQLPAIGLRASLEKLGLTFSRFKTDTPPRVDGDTIDFSVMTEQQGDDEVLNFSFMTENLQRPNVSCWLTYTNKDTHQIIREGLKDSPFYVGMIKGVGPRYCPAIEDKIVRFSDKERHQTFLEPEGMHTKEYYVQGFSTSLAENVQLKMLKSIKGLENVKITRYGYAIEYDYLLPQQLKLSLETKEIRGLFFAGQINGTSGYEEAAAQGILAGINGARYVERKEALILSRAQAYIGVMIDDLVTKGISEPYRMLTSRAEYRLLLRQDNADLRLTEIGYQVGTVSSERYAKYQKKLQDIEREKEKLKTTYIYPEDTQTTNTLQIGPLREKVSLEELLKRPEITYSKLAHLLDGSPMDEAKKQVEIQIKYEGYIQKQARQVEKFEKLEKKKMPLDLNYCKINGLRKEAQQKLEEIKPLSIGQASRISGVNPADINVLLVYLEQRKRGKINDTN